MKIFDFFKRTNESSDSQTFAKANGAEVAISETSMLYSSGDFPKYNPDDLMNRKGFGIYKKMMRDEQIRACIKFKKDAIMSRGYTLQLDAEETGLSEEEVERRIELCHCVLDKMHGSFDDAIRKILTAMQYGFSISEKIYNKIEKDGLTYIGIRAIKLRPADTFQFLVDEFGNLLGIQQDIAGRHSKMEPDHFIHYVVNPDEDEHYGESDLRTCYRAWFSKDAAIKLRNIFMERHAGGFHVMKPPKDKTLAVGSAEYVSMQNVLKNINTLTGVLLPSNGYELHGEYPSGSGSDIFEKTIDQCDIQISRALLVPNLLGITPSGQTGSYSQSETQLDAFFWTLGAESNRLAECINEQLFKELGELNFGDDYYPVFKWNPLSKSKAIEVIKLFTELVSKKVLKNTPADEEFIRSALDLPNVQDYISEEDDNQGNEDDTSGDEDQGEPGDNLDPGDGSEDLTEDEMPDETIVGSQIVRIAATAFKRATSRVSFAIIGTGSEGIVEDSINDITPITDAIISDVLENAKQGGDLDKNISDNVKLRVDSKLNTRLRKAFSKVLQKGEKMGRREASREIDKAMKKSFSKQVDTKRLDFIAEDYFEAASFRITGNVTNEIVKLVETEILNGARYDKTWDEVERAVYAKMASKGMLSVEEAKKQLADDLDVKSPDARMRTIVRTSTFEAINTARDSYFTDPLLGDFIRAYEYSAVLDSATTEICRHLDEDGAGDHSLDWYKANAGFKPPNHFNCRSLLVAVTANDLAEYEEGPTPNVEPMEGFK